MEKLQEFALAKRDSSKPMTMEDRMDRLEENQTAMMGQIQTQNGQLMGCFTKLFGFLESVIPKGQTQIKGNSGKKAIAPPEMVTDDQRPPAAGEVAVIMAIFTFGLGSGTVDIRNPPSSAVRADTGGKALKSKKGKKGGRPALPSKNAHKAKAIIAASSEAYVKIKNDFLKILASKLCTGAKNIFGLKVCLFFILVARLELMLL